MSRDSSRLVGLPQFLKYLLPQGMECWGHWRGRWGKSLFLLTTLGWTSGHQLQPCGQRSPSKAPGRLQPPPLPPCSRHLLSLLRGDVEAGSGWIYSLLPTHSPAILLSWDFLPCPSHEPDYTPLLLKTLPSLWDSTVLAPYPACSAPTNGPLYHTHHFSFLPSELQLPLNNTV